MSDLKIAFGPVPSRRLGRSLGINNIPPKICSYACIYCQLGRTLKMDVKRERFYNPEDIFRDVKIKLDEARKRREHVDYLTFVPDGEPTLDMNLGTEIELLKKLNVRIAVITNSSLIWREDVRSDLTKTDWISFKIDSIDEQVWKKINRPHPSLEIHKILNGISAFKNIFKGKLCTETMLVKNINDDEKNLEKIASFITDISPDISYISIPTRPPAEKYVNIPSEDRLNLAYNIFKERGINVEYLIGYEGNEFAFTGSIKEDILRIASVHPIREEGMKELLRKSGSDWDVVKDLIEEGNIVESKYRNKRFYMRKLSRKRV